MPGLTRDCEDQGVEEANLTAASKIFERVHNDVGILNRKLGGVEQYLHRHMDSILVELIYRLENPRGLRKNEVRHPCAFCDKLLHCSRLTGIIPGDEADEQVRVNGAHVSCAY